MGSNLLTDPEATFETGLSANWVSGVGGPITRVTGGHSGTYAMNIAATTFPGSTLYATLQRDIPITAGIPYLLAGWGRPQAGQNSPSIIIFSFANPGGFSGGPFIDFILASTSGVALGTWGYISQTVTLSAGANYAWIRVLNHPSANAAPGDNCDFDDLFLGIPGRGWVVGSLAMN